MGSLALLPSRIHQVLMANNYSPSPLRLQALLSNLLSLSTTQLKNVESFRYLGSIISNDGSLDKEITTRIQKANQALGRLRTKVLQHKGLRLATKLKVYNAVVISSLLYGCETWTLYRRHVKQLEQFHT